MVGFGTKYQILFRITFRTLITWLFFDNFYKLSMLLLTNRSLLLLLLSSSTHFV